MGLDRDEIEFVAAIEKYKNQNDKLFLKWSEVMSIVKELGYRKETNGKSNATVE